MAGSVSVGGGMDYPGQTSWEWAQAHGWENIADPWKPGFVTQPVYRGEQLEDKVGPMAALGALGKIGKTFSTMERNAPSTADRYDRTFGQSWSGAYQIDPQVRQNIVNAMGGFKDPYTAQGQDDLNRLAAGFSGLGQMPQFGSVTRQAVRSLADAIAGQKSAAVSARGVNPALAARMAREGGDQASAQMRAALPMLVAQERQQQQQQAMQAAGLAGSVYGAAGQLGLQGATNQDQFTQAMLGRLSDADKLRLTGSIAQQGANQDYANMLLGIPQNIIGGGTQLRVSEIGAAGLPSWMTYVGAGTQALGGFGAALASRMGGNQPTGSYISPNTPTGNQSYLGSNTSWQTGQPQAMFPAY